MKKLLCMLMVCTALPSLAQTHRVFALHSVDCPDSAPALLQNLPASLQAPVEVHLMAGEATELVTLSESQEMGEIVTEEYQLSQGGIGPMSRNGDAVFMAVPQTLTGEMRNFFVEVAADENSLIIHRLDRRGELCGVRGPVAVTYKTSQI